MLSPSLYSSYYRCLVYPVVCVEEILRTHSKYQSVMYTRSLSAFIQSKELFMCWTGVGAVSHRGRIVSTAQSSWLPSSCAWPVSLGSLRHSGMCVYVWVGVCIGVCHPSGVEQLFYQQGSESFPTSPGGKKCLPTFYREDGGGIRSCSLEFVLYSSSQPWCHWFSMMRRANILRNKKDGEAVLFILL